MSVKERLLEYLQEKYGITTQQELEEALARQEKLDITIFVADCGEANEANGGNEHGNEM